MIRRHLQPLVEGALKAFPVVLITGARQVGKSTLAKALIGRRWPAAYLTLDDPGTLGTALSDPDGLLRAHDAPLVIDEVQRAPDLLRAIKLLVDRRRRPGRYLLTGSANLMTLRTVSETLAGRVALHRLWPFSWSERTGQALPTFFGDLFRAAQAGTILRKYFGQRPPRADLREAIFRGGYPPPSLMSSAARRRQWFEGYRQTYLERDLRDLTNILYLPEFNRLLTLAALRSGQTLNLAAFARELALQEMTVKRYIGLLEQTFQVTIVPPYYTNVGLRLVKTPKLYASDTGLACYLSGARDWNTLEQQGRLGAMLETWVAAELVKWMALQDDYYQLYFWRTHTGKEVDFLLARGEEMVAIEVKESATLSRRDWAGIEACEDALGKRLRFSVILHRGDQVLGLTPRRLAVPVESAFLGSRDAS